MTETTKKALEILNTPFHGGSRVTNCVTHMGMEWSDRPHSCDNCITDMGNTINYAFRVNDFLNEIVDNAKQVLSGIRESLFIPDPGEVNR